MSLSINYSISYPDAIRSSGEYYSVVLLQKEVSSNGHRQTAPTDGEIVNAVKSILPILSDNCYEFAEDAKSRSQNGDKAVIMDTQEMKEIISSIIVKISNSRLRMSLKKDLEILKDLEEYFIELESDFQLRFNILPHNKQIGKLLASIR